MSINSQKWLEIAKIMDGILDDLKWTEHRHALALLHGKF